MRGSRSGRACRRPHAPIARLLVDVPLSHLDRPFDYLVPEELDGDVAVGGRVRVRFAGQLVDGYVLERGTQSDHDGQLAFIERAVGSEPVLTPQTTALFRAVADRWAGNFVDAVRLGVPPRHAGAGGRAADPAVCPAAPCGGGLGDVPSWPGFRRGGGRRPGGPRCLVRPARRGMAESARRVGAGSLGRWARCDRPGARRA